MPRHREHIARLAETVTTATIGIVPFAAHAPIGTLNAWSLMDDLATTETDGGNLKIVDAQHVERYWHYTPAAPGWRRHKATTPAALCRRITHEASCARHLDVAAISSGCQWRGTRPRSRTGQWRLAVHRHSSAS